MKKSSAPGASQTEQSCFIPTRPPAIVCAFAAVIGFIYRCRTTMANWLFIRQRPGETIEQLRREWDSAHRANSELQVKLATKSMEAEDWRCAAIRHAAQLKQLSADIVKVQLSNEDPASRGRVGWQVSAWIPEPILDSVRAGNPELNVFVRTVTDTLVNNAIVRIFKRNPAGYCTALVFGDKGKMDGWYEGDPSKPGITYNSQGDAAIRRITGRDLVEDAARILSGLPQRVRKIALDELNKSNA